jgi:S-adenosylmethionine decarboxylase
MHGTEWIVDAHGCDASALRNPVLLGDLFDQIVELLQLTPVGRPTWHTFPPPGGVTGFLILAESHLACHTFPEFRSICLNVFCCHPRETADLAGIVTRVLGATSAAVRKVEREYVGPSGVRS